MSERESQDIIQNSKTAQSHSEFYDEVWKTAPQLPAQVESYSQIRMDFIDYVMRQYIKPASELNILDLGCGSGWLTAFVSKYGSATGVDFAPNAIRAAQEKYAGKASFVVADAESPTLGVPMDKPYDLVISSEVIEHIENQPAHLRTITQFLGRNGWLIFTTPNKRLWDFYTTEPRFEANVQPIENWLTPEEAVALLHDASFDIFWHEGWADYAYSTLLHKLVCNRVVRQTMRRAGVYHPYAKLIAPLCMMQMFLARRRAG